MSINESLQSFTRVTFNANQYGRLYSQFAHEAWIHANELARKHEATGNTEQAAEWERKANYWRDLSEHAPDMS